MKPTDKNLAEFYNLTRQTIASYRNKKLKIYLAMLEYFIKMHNK